MILLTGTNHSIEVTISGIPIIVDWQASFVDTTTSTYTPVSDHGSHNVATTFNAVTSPAASTQRHVKSLTFRNRNTGVASVTISKKVGANTYQLYAASLENGGAIIYEDGAGWEVVDAQGRKRVTALSDTGINGATTAIYKIGTAAEAAGQWYSWAKDSGFPGAWAPGTPGINGRATDGTATADAGCLLIKPAVTGNNYLTNFTGSTSVACNPWLFDVLWVNSGLSVTTTSAQAITPVSLPSRDADGGNSGKDVWMGLLVTTATTQAGAVTTISASYTNSSGVSGRTATVASFPATAVIGTVVWFRLAAGDSGVQSVQSVTLGTTLTAGAISLILARPLWSFPSLVANVGGLNVPPQTPGVRLYPGTCALPIGLMSATTATTLQATVTVMER